MGIALTRMFPGQCFTASFSIAQGQMPVFAEMAVSQMATELSSYPSPFRRSEDVPWHIPGVSRFSTEGPIVEMAVVVVPRGEQWTPTGMVEGAAISLQTSGFDDPQDASAEPLPIEARFEDPESHTPWDYALPNLGQINMGLLQRHPDDMVMYVEQFYRISHDGNLSLEERILLFSSFLYIFASPYVNFWDQKERWKSEPLAWARQRDSREQQLAGSIAVAYLQKLDAFPDAIDVLVDHGCSHYNRVIQLKSALALLYSKAPAAIHEVANRFDHFSPEVQDRIIRALVSRPQAGMSPLWRRTIARYIELAALPGAENSAEDLRGARGWINILEFRNCLVADPNLLREAKEQYFRGMQEYNARRTGIAYDIPADAAALSDDDLLGRSIPTLGAAIGLVVRHPELGEAEIGHRARAAIAAELPLLVIGYSGLIDEVRLIEMERSSIPASDFVLAMRGLLNDGNARTSILAALGILGREQRGSHAQAALEALWKFFRRPDFFSAVPADIISSVLEMGMDKRLTDAGFFRDRAMLDNFIGLIRSRDEKDLNRDRALRSYLRNASAEDLMRLLRAISADSLFASLRFEGEESFSHPELLGNALLQIARERGLRARQGAFFGIFAWLAADTDWEDAFVEASVESSDGQEEVVAVLRDGLAQSQNPRVRFSFANALAWSGVYDAPGQAEAFKTILRQELEGLEEQHRDPYLFGIQPQELDGIEPGKLAGIAAARSDLHYSRRDVEETLLLRMLLSEEAAPGQKAFAATVILYGQLGNDSINRALTEIAPAHLRSSIPIQAFVHSRRSEAQVLRTRLFGDGHSQFERKEAFDRALHDLRRRSRG